jgi:arsenate reductase (glutaredoxin)
MKLYGIKNCDTVKKSRAWLDAHGIAYEFVDFNKTPPTTDEIARWCDALGVNVVLNRRGTTWKKLTDNERASAAFIEGVIALMVAHPSAIKRPVIEIGPTFLIGFDDGAYRVQFL